LLETPVAWPNATGYTKPDALPRFIDDIMQDIYEIEFAGIEMLPGISHLV